MSSKSEVRRKKSEIRRQKEEGRRKKAEGRRQEEVRRKKAEGRSEKSEGRSEKSEDRRTRRTLTVVGCELRVPGLPREGGEPHPAASVGLAERDWPDGRMSTAKMATDLERFRAEAAI